MKHIKNYTIFDSIKVPIEVGDTVLTGRFKNKKMIVKKIGKNKKGDITINDKPLLKFRIIKESLKEEISINLAHLIDEGFLISVTESYSTDKCYFVRIWLPIDKSDTEYSYENSQDFNWIDIEDEIVRGIHYMVEHYDVEYLYTIASREQDGFGYKRMEWNVDLLLKNGTFGFANPGKIKCIFINLIPHPELKSIF